MRRFRPHGFTLIEMVLAITLIGLLSALGSLLLSHSFDSFNLTRDTASLGWPGRIALERMTRELREMRSQTAADMPLWSNSVLDFYDSRGNRERYYVVGTQLVRSSDGGASYQPIANNVSNLTFAYTAKDGSALVPSVGNEGSVYYVSVSFSVTVNGNQENYRVSVNPRLFQ